MSSGLRGAPWWAIFIMYLVGQGGLMLAQVLAYRQGGGVFVTLGLAAMQLIAAVAGAYGPRAAGSLAKNVGKAIDTGRGHQDGDTVKNDGSPPDSSRVGP